MLLATIPVYKTDKEREKEKDEEIDFGNDVNALANYINNLK